MRAFAVLLAAAVLVSAQTPKGENGAYDRAAEQNFRVYSDHPRLLLTSARLRLLRRERERQSPRWQQYELLIRGKAQMPEPGFALALYYQVSGERQAGLQAIEWAAGQAADLRQIALVFDWCQPLLDARTRKVLAGKLQRGLEGGQVSGPVSARDRAFAAIAVADDTESDVSSPALEAVVTRWWRATAAPAWRAGKRNFSRPELYAVLELLHAIRDNLKIDLREEIGRVFNDLPASLLLSYYPAAFPAPENDYRVPFFTADGDPDLRIAALSRALELAFVAFDSNLRSSQFLQGWLMHDRFALRGTFGAPYEFLWANPYLPGLSYYHMPLFVHDQTRGELYLRSGWEDDARWLGYRAGRVQIFRDGKRAELTARSATREIDIGDATVVVANGPTVIQRAADRPPNVFVVGLKPSTLYTVEVDGEEMEEATSDTGGIVPVFSLRTDPRRIRIAAPRAAAAQ